MFEQSRKSPPSPSNPLLLASLATGVLVGGAYLLTRSPSRGTEVAGPNAPSSIASLDQRALLLPPDLPFNELTESELQGLAIEPTRSNPSRLVVQITGPTPGLQFEKEEPIEPCAYPPSIFPKEFQEYRSEFVGHVANQRIAKAANLMEDQTIDDRFGPIINCASDLGLGAQLRVTLIDTVQRETIPEMRQALLRLIENNSSWNFDLLGLELWTSSPNLFPVLEEVCADHNCNLLTPMLGLLPNAEDLSEQERKRVADNLVYAIAGFNPELHATRCISDDEIYFATSEKLHEYGVDFKEQLPILLSSPVPDVQTIGLVALRDYYYKLLAQETDWNDYDTFKQTVQVQVREYLTYLPASAAQAPQVKQAYESLEKHLAGQVYRGPSDCAVPSTPSTEIVEAAKKASG